MIEGVLLGAGLASLLWGGAFVWLRAQHAQQVQAALNLPRASSHHDIKLHLLHERQMRTMTRK